MQQRVAVTCLLAVSLLAFDADAGPPEGKGPGYHHAEQSHPGRGSQGRGPTHGTSDYRERHRDRELVDVVIDAGISAVLAREYARDAGLRGYAGLPPGIRKNLARGKPLPPGIAKKVGSGRFLDRLPRHQGYEWQTVGTDLILVSVATGVIADILFDVFD